MELCKTSLGTLIFQVSGGKETKRQRSFAAGIIAPRLQHTSSIVDLRRSQINPCYFYCVENSNIYITIQTVDAAKASPSIFLH
jgi:hypothetical protein